MSRILLSVTGVVVLAMIAACGCASSSNPGTSNKEMIRVLRGADDSAVPVARSQQAVDRMQALIEANDNIGVRELYSAGLVWNIESGTKCRITDLGFNSSEVRILDGEHSGVACFVQSVFVKP